MTEQRINEIALRALVVLAALGFAVLVYVQFVKG